ncbi:MAG TPA: choline/ethanolamine kinase family protein [Streptosporangiaceae bacterium]
MGGEQPGAGTAVRAASLPAACSPDDPAALLAGLPSLAATPREIEELPGGLTNRNYKVSTPRGVFVARVWQAGGELLAIDRENEYRNSVIAAQSGAGAPVVEYRPQDGVLVIEYLEGRTLTNADVAQPGTIKRIAAACRLLHGGGRFVNDFDMFAIQARYRQVAAARGIRVPAGYDDLLPRFEAVRDALAATASGTVPCNNDLLAANFIDDGERIALIDYEYAGNNDPCFELGNIAAECRLQPDGLAGLVTAYDGAARRSRIARARLLGLAGMYGWTLWGAIQSATSPIDYDFRAWAAERFDGAAAGLRSAGLAGLLEDVQRAD